MSDLIERLRWVVSHMNEGSEGEEAVFDAISEIESLQARIEQLEPFERLAKMSGQNIGLRLMDAEARIEELETDIMAYKKHFGQPVGSDSRETWKEKYKKAQARIAELEAYYLAVDNACIVSHIGTAESFASAEQAVNAIGAWSESVGAYFAQARIAELEEDVKFYKRYQDEAYAQPPEE